MNLGLFLERIFKSEITLFDNQKSAGQRGKTTKVITSDLDKLLSTFNLMLACPKR